MLVAALLILYFAEPVETTLITVSKIENSFTFLLLTISLSINNAKVRPIQTFFVIPFLLIVI